jgi:valyl-tRNA synthetase
MSDGKYNASAIEAAWQQNWHESEIGKAGTASDSNYCIMLPPPNITGSLHMGHGFQITLMDALIRYKRMSGNNTLWQMGTDHSGIAAQMVVERQLAAQDISKHDLGREKFIEKIWEWKDQSAGQIGQQIKEIGGSVDWSSERFTMDPELCAVVRDVFIKLYRDDLIYRGPRLVNWDPKLKTAISDLEVEKRPKKGHLWHIRYPIVGSDKFLVVATTRPETLFGDSAVAVHPEDERYKNLVGKQCALPFCERNITIIADTMVDREFGSGCVKITPAHDFNDYATGKRNNLEMINIMTEDAHLNENAPKKYQGLDRFAARKQLISDLEEAGLLEKIDDHDLQVPYGDRSGVVIEPLLTDQWFVKTDSLAKPAVDAVNNGQLNFVPDNWKNTYLKWLENIEDWCISRQLWWGHRIPAWHDAAGEIYVAESEAAVREHYNLSADHKLEQDPDVLDTWFSSALWPFSTLGWPEKTQAFTQFYPTQVLVTGFDIIFFWVARMVMFGLYFTGEVPFKEVYVTGLIRDQNGNKMSKSKGNVLDPLDLVNGIGLDDLIAKRTHGLMQPQMAEKIRKATTKEFPDGIAASGTDALRFTFCALAAHGRDINFDLQRLQGYKNFCNKIWNASRFVMQSCADQPIGQQHSQTIAAKFIRAKINDCVIKAHQHFANYRFDLLAKAIYETFWNEFCDWYLELAKVDLATQDGADVRYTLLHCLDTLLRLLHPIMPFITDELWQPVATALGHTQQSLDFASYPVAESNLETADGFAHIQNLITQIRTRKSELNIAPGAQMSLHSSTKPDWCAHGFAYISQLARINAIDYDFLITEHAAENYLDIKIANNTFYLNTTGHIDLEAEKARKAKQTAKLEQELASLRGRLSNPKFADKAPAEVVQQVQARIIELENMLG